MKFTDKGPRFIRGAVGQDQFETNEVIGAFEQMFKGVFKRSCAFHMPAVTHKFLSKFISRVRVRINN